jgi:hypothetical protein
LNARPLPYVPAAATVAFLIALAAGLSSQPAQPASLTLLAKEGRRTLPLTMVADQEFVALDDLATAFQLTVREESLGAITVSYKGKTVVLTPDQALASVSGRLISLPAPPSRNGRRWLVPVEFINRALGLIYDSRLDLRKPSRLLVIGDLRVPRISVRYELLGASGRLTIDATPRAQSTITQETDHLTVKFEADALDAPNPPLPAPGAQSLVQGVRIVDATTLAVDLGPRFAGFKATWVVRVVDDAGVVYVERESRTSVRERPRSGQYLTTAAAALGSGRNEVIDSYGTVERPRSALFLDERSITYATTGPRLSRERVVIEEAGRRRESYQLIR